jgi:hypothetical protein
MELEDSMKKDLLERDAKYYPLAHKEQILILNFNWNL